MLIYVIPFILLLVIAVVLKKRDSSKQAEESSSNKGKAKKVVLNKQAAKKTKIVANTTVEKKKTTPLPAEQRNKIEALIQHGDFSVAEAQINQALNKDNSQHELYLLLLDIHILQKDEFAISQLINHLGSLELDDFLEQALAKKAAHDQKILSARDTIDFKSESFVPQAHSSAAVEPKSTADFDALIDDSASNSDGSFNFQSTTAEIIEEIKPLDFNSFSMNKTPVAAEKVVTSEKDAALDFSSLSFDINPNVTAKPELTATVDEIQPLDFSFSVDSPAVEQVVIATERPVPAEVRIEDKAEFDFDFSAPTATTTLEAPVIVEEPKSSLGLDFNLEANSLTASAPVTIEPSVAATAAVNFDIGSVHTSKSQVDQHDPLVQSFPELLAVNEISLNLELAEQYIQLGAFESAGELLLEQEAEYSAEQLQHAQQLRNQIAS